MMHDQYASDPSSEHDDALDAFLFQEDEAILQNEMAYEIFLATGIDNS